MNEHEMNELHEQDIYFARCRQEHPKRFCLIRCEIMMEDLERKFKRESFSDAFVQEFHSVMSRVVRLCKLYSVTRDELVQHCAGKGIRMRYTA